MDVGKITKVHEDERRAIFEYNSIESNFSIQSFRIKTKIPLGNHYHKNKEEIFVILKGKGKLITCPVNQEGVVIEEKQKIDICAGSVIKIKSYTAHTFLLEPNSEMICFSSAAFDPNDLITHKLA